MEAMQMHMTKCIAQVLAASGQQHSETQGNGGRLGNTLIAWPQPCCSGQLSDHTRCAIALFAIAKCNILQKSQQLKSWHILETTVKLQSVALCFHRGQDQQHVSMHEQICSQNWPFRDQYHEQRHPPHFRQALPPCISQHVVHSMFTDAAGCTRIPA